jgi:hypothetical protein
MRGGAGNGRSSCEMWWVATAVRHLAQQRVQPTPPLRHFRPEKMVVVQPVLPRKLVVLRWRG